MVSPICLMAATDSWVADWIPMICWLISPVGLGGLFGQRLYLGGKGAALLGTTLTQ
jgi:hypothetical protein